MKKRVNILILVIVLISLTISVSYAYWQFKKTDEKTNTATSGCFKMELTNQANEINLNNAYPISDEEGLKLKPFSFTVHNNCDIFAHYYVTLEALEGTTLDSKWVALKLNSDAITTLDKFDKTTPTIKGSVDSRILAEGYLGTDDSVDYSISFWMDKGATINDDVMNKTFASKIVIVSEPSDYDPVSAGYSNLGDAILANEYQTTSEIAKQKIASKQEVDLSNTAPVINWVEKTGDNTTINVIKPAESVIATYNKDTGTGDKTTQASNLTLNDTKIKLYTTKSFNSDTAKYTLSNMIYADPTTLDYSGDIKYYYASENIIYNQTSKKLYTWNSTSDLTIYQVTSATKTNSKTTWNNVSYDSITYNLSSLTLSEMELETDKSDKGLYQSTDDYGTTYYYRGNVKNNNVYFAGFYWQIVRINGDGSIRLIYNGTEKDAVGLKKSINNATYIFNNKSNNPAYHGYMYDNPDGTTFDEVHANTTSSNIKNAIDNWYKKNIDDKGYSDYISSNVGFCGDRSIYSGGNGIQTNKTTYFGAYGRYMNNTALFSCPEPSRDLYTTNNADIGNKALTYPVGLITYDEMVFAGMDYHHLNKLSWIYSGEHTWTMSPAYFNAGSGLANNWNENSASHLGYWSVTHSLNVRPVINLKADIKIISGIGTSSEPYVIKTN